MKKSFFAALLVLLVGTVAQAQILGSTSKKIETTYTTTTQTVTEEYKNYNRIIFGYASTRMKGKVEGYGSDSDSNHGFDLGWTGGYNVTKGKHLPLYVETGLHMNVFASEDPLLNFEVPVNVTYRYTIGHSKVRVAPYLGIHFKVNALWQDDHKNSYFDFDGSKRFQMGMQLGVNFDIKHFHIGLGWDKDFSPLFNGELYNGSYYDYKISTSGARVNIGIVW